MELPPQSPQSDFAPPLRVLAAAGNALARAGLAALLAERPGLEIVGQSGIADELEAALDLYRPDVVVCDLGYDPLAAVEWLNEQLPDGPPVIALAAGAQAASEALSALLGAGVRGVLLQAAQPTALAAAIGAVSHGLTVIGPEISASFTGAHPSAAPRSEVEAFTPREREVLALLAEGLPNKLIARQLHISEHTVKFHINGLLTKLGVSSRTEAVVRATRLGLIAL